MKKRFLHIIIIFCLITVLLIDVVSAFSLSVFMTPSTTNVEQASEVVIKVKVANLNVGDNGINTFTGNINVDTEVFEPVTTENISAFNNWVSSYVQETGKITLFKTTFVNSDEELFQIKLKTKENISKNSGTIKIENIIVSNGEDEITASEVSTSISIGNSGVVIGNNTTTNSTNNQAVYNNTSSGGIQITPTVNNTYSNYANNNNSSNNMAVNNKVNNASVNNKAANINNNASVTNSDVPYTGTRENVRIAIIVILAIAAYIYIKFEKLNNIC